MSNQISERRVAVQTRFVHKVLLTTLGMLLFFPVAIFKFMKCLLRGLFLHLWPDAFLLELVNGPPYSFMPDTSGGSR